MKKKEFKSIFDKKKLLISKEKLNIFLNNIM